MGEIGPSLAVRGRTPNRMTGRALLPEKCLLASRRFQIWRGGDILALQISPLLKRRRLFGYDKECHVGMLQATKLRALAAINPGALGPDDQFVRAPRHEVLLACQTWHPERMNHIDTLQLKAHIPPYRDMNFIGRFKTLVFRRAKIFYAPPPLQASHLDREIVVAGDIQAPRGKEA